MRATTLIRRSAAGGEDGFVMVIVMIVLMVALLLGAAGLAESLDARTLSYRDARVRRAQQAADAGIQTQLYQQSENQIGNTNSSYDLNGGILSLSHFLDCIEPQFNASLQVSGLVQSNVGSGGVCPVNGGGGNGNSGFVPTALGDHAFVESEFIPGATTPISGASEADLSPRIVSLGWDGTSTSSASGNVFSREEAILSPISPLPVVGSNGNTTINGISTSGGILTALLAVLGLSNLATTVNGDIQTAGNLTLPAVDASINLTLKNGLLGVVKYGGTLTPSNGITVAQRLNTTPAPRQPVTISSTKTDCPAPDSNGASNCSDISTYYTASTDSVNVPAGKTMTLYGGDYVFCNFYAAGTVNASPTASQPVRIFIDSPTSARCAGNSPTESTNSTFAHTEWSEGDLTALLGINNSEGVTTPSGVQIYVVGDEATPPDDDNTFVQIGTPGAGTDGGLLSTNPAAEQMILYAPTSDVSMTTATCVSVPLVATICVPGVFTGNLIGNDVSATALTFTQDLNLANDPLYNGVNAYHVEQYVQCTALPTDSSGNTYTSLQQNSVTDTNGC